MSATAHSPVLCEAPKSRPSIVRLPRKGHHGHSLTITQGGQSLPSVELRHLPTGHLVALQAAQHAHTLDSSRQSKHTCVCTPIHTYAHTCTRTQAVYTQVTQLAGAAAPGAPIRASHHQGHLPHSHAKPGEGRVSFPPGTQGDEHRGSSDLASSAAHGLLRSHQFFRSVHGVAQSCPHCLRGSAPFAGASPHPHPASGPQGTWPQDSLNSCPEQRLSACPQGQGPCPHWVPNPFLSLGPVSIPVPSGQSEILQRPCPTLHPQLTLMTPWGRCPLTLCRTQTRASST